MSEENRATAEHCPGNFGECLVGGSAEEQVRRRKIKRRALVTSVALQTIGLAALVIAPLLAKTPEIKTVSAMPIPPYSPPRPSHPPGDPMPPHRATDACVVCPHLPIAPITPTFTRQEPTTPGEVESLSGVGTPTNTSLIGIGDVRPQPPRPPDTIPEIKRVHKTSIDPALLVHRVEPIYPPLPKQLHRSGKVELHAIIATDGSIQSLEVVSGDPMFIPSALDAVRQWHYKPTYLNGQPVEIDTFITVIYTLNSGN